MRFDSQRQRQRRRVFSRNIPSSLGAIAREHDSRLCFPEAACVKLFETLLYLWKEKKEKVLRDFIAERQSTRCVAVWKCMCQRLGGDAAYFD